MSSCKYHFIKNQAKISVPTVYTKNAASHAVTHCINTIAKADLPFSSRFTAAIAAMQGVYKSVNARKLAAVTGVNTPESTVPSSDTLEPVSTANVDTTDSFAEKPVISAVTALQSPKPRGLKIGAITIPSIAKRLSELFST